MPTTYPAATDSFTAVVAGQPRDGTGSSPAESTTLTDLGDAVEAIETELGVNPKGAASHVAARIASVESTATSAVAAAAAAAATASAAQTTANAAIPKGTVNAKGDILVATADDTLDRLAVGANDQVLTADSTTPTGTKWATPSGGAGGSVATDTLWDAKGDLAAGTGANAAVKLVVGANDQAVVADSAQANGLKYYDVVLGRKGGKEIVETTAASGSAKTIDLINGNCFDVTLTANCTLTLTGLTSGVLCSFMVILRQDATGSRTITWPAAVKWAGGSTPVWTTTATKADIVALFSVNGGTTVYGSVIGQAF